MWNRELGQAGLKVCKHVIDEVHRKIVFRGIACLLSGIRKGKAKTSR